MVKKITPDPPAESKDSKPDDGSALHGIVDGSNGSVKSASLHTARLLDTLALTVSKTIDHTDPLKPSIFAIQPGVNAQEALIYVSKLLEAAELNGDEISLHTNPVERSLFWGMLHSVEMARAVVDALLEGSSSAHRASPTLDDQPFD
ncbi:MULTISPECIES: hypothetical protein [Pseudomonas]|uniref:DUF3077 domain-containing protein n=1 Tax=Pseudomonas gingeri TaxID=117681 RepID=A0A7Y7WVS5_9PSED|nr:hypothetical protein [Pseudomonas sp. MWU12-2323]NWB88619.1 hypothetical protein [Pseudomonas gingeri]